MVTTNHQKLPEASEFGDQFVGQVGNQSCRQRADRLWEDTLNLAGVCKSQVNCGMFDFVGFVEQAQKEGM